MGKLLDTFRTNYSATREEELSLDEYLDLCRKDPRVYATAAERMLAGIGDPEFVDTRNDPRLGRLFGNRVIRRYPAFREFYGMEDAIEQIVAFFKHAAQGLEEKKQILYLLGPVGGGKSSIAERLKSVMETHPIYALKGSPVNESPLGLFAPEQLRADPAGRIRHPAPLPERHHVAVGDQAAAGIRRRHHAVPGRAHHAVGAAPGRHHQDRAGRREQPGHLVPRRQDRHPQARALRAERPRRLQLLGRPVPRQPGPARIRGDVQGADQDAAPVADRDAGRQLQGHGRASPPSRSTASSSRTRNESEWHSFRNNKNNEAFLDRIYIVKVPYCLRVSDEVKIYEKLLANSSLSKAPCAPGTLDMMAQFSVLSRLKEPENSSIYSKMRVYDGETLKDVDPKAKTLQEYRDYAGADEGMTGLSTRFAYKVLSAVFNHDQTEIAANPVHLMYVLEQRLAREDLPDEVRRRYIEHLKGYLAPRYAEFIGKEIQTAYLESYCGIRPEHLRPLRDLRRLLDPGRGLPRSGDRRELRSRRRSTPSSRRSRSPSASPIRRTSATRSSTTCCARAPTTAAAIRRGTATRSCARSSRRRCSATPRTCCR